MKVAYPHTTLLSLTSPEAAQEGGRARIEIHPARRRVPGLPLDCEGFHVIAPHGRVGSVELVRRLPGHGDELVIVGGLFSRRRYTAAAADIESVDVSRRRIRLRRAPIATVDADPAA